MGVAGRQHAYSELLAYVGDQHPTIHLAFDNDAAGKHATALAAAELCALGFPIVQAVWPDQYKGLDDALWAGAELTYKLVAGRGLAKLSPALMDAIAAASPQPEYVSIEAARAFNQQTVADALDHLRAGGSSGRVGLLTSTTGTGKSVAARLALAAFAASGWPTVARLRRAPGDGVLRERQPARVAVLVDQRQQVNDWLELLATLGLASVPLVGRVQAPAPAGFE